MTFLEMGGLRIWIYIFVISIFEFLEFAIYGIAINIYNAFL